MVGECPADKVKRLFGGVHGTKASRKLLCSSVSRRLCLFAAPAAVSLEEGTSGTGCGSTSSRCRIRRGC